MKAHIEINLDNDEFAGGQHHRGLARILRELANKIEHETPAKLTVRDLNGNRIGKFVLMGGRDD